MPDSDTAREQALAQADREWGSYVSSFPGMGCRLAEQMVGLDDRQVRAELFQRILTGASAASMGMLMLDPDYPEFWPGWGLQHNFWVPNPDGVYTLSIINPVGVYKLTGYRGSVRLVDVQLGHSPLIRNGTGGLVNGIGHVYDNFSLDSLNIGMDGHFEVILSCQRPAGYAGDWWQLPASAKLKPNDVYVAVRQFSYDWETEVDARLSIERLDIPARRPRVRAETIEANMRKFVPFVEAWTAYAQEWMKKYWDKGLVNKMLNENFSKNAAGIKDQWYFQGFYDFDPETEGLILETDVPECQYWCIQMTDAVCGSTDFIHHITHVNGYTARLSADGKLRCVVAAKDPGVPNWLDTVGYDKGFVFGRWKRINDPFLAEHPPTPTLTRVKLTAVRDHLPAGTPMVTPEQRDAALRRHRKWAQLRRRW